MKKEKGQMLGSYSWNNTKKIAKKKWVRNFPVIFSRITNT